MDGNGTDIDDGGSNINDIGMETNVINPTMAVNLTLVERWVIYYCYWMGFLVVFVGEPEWQKKEPYEDNMEAWYDTF